MALRKSVKEADVEIISLGIKCNLHIKSSVAFNQNCRSGRRKFIFQCYTMSTTYEQQQDGWLDEEKKFTQPFAIVLELFNVACQASVSRVSLLHISKHRATMQFIKLQLSLLPQLLEAFAPLEMKRYSFYFWTTPLERINECFKEKWKRAPRVTFAEWINRKVCCNH